MIAWSAGAFIIPLLNTILLQFFPVEMFMQVILWLSALFAVFVISRMIARGGVDPAETENFQYATAQVVNTTEFYNPESQDQIEAKKTAGTSQGLII